MASCCAFLRLYRPLAPQHHLRVVLPPPPLYIPFALLTAVPPRPSPSLVMVQAARGPPPPKAAPRGYIPGARGAPPPGRGPAPRGPPPPPRPVMAPKPGPQVRGPHPGPVPVAVTVVQPVVVTRPVTAPMPTSGRAPSASMTRGPPGPAQQRGPPATMVRGPPMAVPVPAHAPRGVVPIPTPVAVVPAPGPIPRGVAMMGPPPPPPGVMAAPGPPRGVVLVPTGAPPARSGKANGSHEKSSSKSLSALLNKATQRMLPSSASPSPVPQQPKGLKPPLQAGCHTELQPGNELNHEGLKYKVVSVLGSGCFGSVFKVRVLLCLCARFFFLWDLSHCLGQVYRRCMLQAFMYVGTCML